MQGQPTIPSQSKLVFESFTKGQIDFTDLNTYKENGETICDCDSDMDSGEIKNNQNALFY